MCIPPAFMFSLALVSWGWTTFVDVNVGTDKNFSLVGVNGATIIAVSGGGAIFRVQNNCPGTYYVADLIFIAANAVAGTDATNVIDMNQCRDGIMERCQFWGIRCNATGFGVVRIVADNIHFQDNIFVGCDYTGTAYQGGVTCLTGERDGCIVESCRWDGNGISFNGVAYGKAFSATLGCLWFGGQGPQPPPAQPAYGGVGVGNCHFDGIAAALFLIAFAPVAPNVISYAKVEHTSFNLAGGAGTTGIYLANCQMLEVNQCNFNGSAVDAILVTTNITDSVVVRSSANDNGQFIEFTGACRYLKLENCAKSGVSDYSIAAATNGFVVKGVGSTLLRNCSEEIDGAIHHLAVDARDLPSATLVALYDANLGITLNGANVSAWANSSGAADANRNLSQGNAAKQPPYNAADAAYNGQASIGNFNSVAAQSLVSGGNWSVAPPTTGFIVAVFNTGGAASTEILFRDTGVAQYEVYQNASNKRLDLFFNAVYGAAANATNLNTKTIVGFDMNANVSRMYQNATTPTEVPGDPGTVAPLQIEVSGAGTWQGKIAYLAFFSTRPSHDDIQRLFEGLGSRYNVRIAA